MVIVFVFNNNIHRKMVQVLDTIYMINYTENMSPFIRPNGEINYYLHGKQYSKKIIIKN